MGVAAGPNLKPDHIGRQRQIDLTADAVSSGDGDGDDCGTLPTSISCRSRDQPSARPISSQALAGERRLRTDHPGKLMAYGRAACALGVGKALGEITTQKAVAEAVLRRSRPFFQRRQPLGRRRGALQCDCRHRPQQGLGRRPDDRPRADGRCARSFRRPSHAPVAWIFGRLSTERGRERADQGWFRQVRGGEGWPYPEPAARDAQRRRHRPAAAYPRAVGAIVASVLGDTALFVSGGAEHQGPDGGGLVSLIVERPGEA